MGGEEIADFITDKQIRRLIILELFQERMIRFSGDQMIEHIHCGGEKRFDAGLSGRIGQALGNKAFADSGIADQDDIFLLFDKVQVHKVKNQIFLFLP